MILRQEPVYFVYTGATTPSQVEYDSLASNHRVRWGLSHQRSLCTVWYAFGAPRSIPPVSMYLCTPVCEAGTFASQIMMTSCVRRIECPLRLYSGASGLSPQGLFNPRMPVTTDTPSNFAVVVCTRPTPCTRINKLKSDAAVRSHQLNR